MAKDDFRLYKRGKIFWARKRRNGKEYDRPLDTQDEGIARQRARKWLAELIATDWGEKPEMTFDQAMERYAEERFPLLAESTAKRYAASFEHLHAHFKGIPLSKITASPLYDFERKRRLDVTTATVRRDLSVLSSVFVMAQLWEEATTNPVRPFLEARGKMGLVESDARTRYLSHDEEEALLRHAGDTFRPLFAFDIDTGLRRGELRTLGWKHVKLDIPSSDFVSTRGQIKVEKRRTKTKGGSRSVPLLDRSYDYLKFAERKGIAVFGTADGKPYSAESPTVWEALKKSARKAGIEDLTVHDLRRTCGCRLLQDYGAPMEIVSRWLGHSSIKVTETRYAFLTDEEMHRAVERGRPNVIKLNERRAKIISSGDK
jgi:integrase